MILFQFVKAFYNVPNLDTPFKIYLDPKGSFWTSELVISLLFSLTKKTKATITINSDWRVYHKMIEKISQVAFSFQSINHLQYNIWDWEENSFAGLFTTTRFCGKKSQPINIPVWNTQSNLFGRYWLVR